MNLINAFLLFISFYFCFIVVKIAGLIIQTPKKLTKPKKILYLSPFFPENAGYIYRSKKWADILSEAGFKVEIKNTLSKEQFYPFLENRDVRFYLIPLFKRVWHILSSYKYDVVIVRREIVLFNDYGNLFLEKALLKIHPEAILDFDDNISAAKREPRQIESLYSKLMLENGEKFKDSLRLYRRFIVGSKYLKNMVLAENKQIDESDICIIPTCVDYKTHPQKKYDLKNKTPVVLGWIGSNGNLKFLEEIIPQINEINRQIPVKLIVISGRKIKHEVDFEIDNRMWSYETQIKDLLEVDVGLMPLRDTPRERGKCGFKLIQYMGLGIVSLATAVTINNEIVDDKINGFLIEPAGNWSEKLKEVLLLQERFGEIGELAQKKICENYSFSSNAEKYISFIEKTYI